MEFDFGNRESPVLIVTDTGLDSGVRPGAEVPALHRGGGLYNGLIVPMKFYLNQYLLLNSPLRLISETMGREPFHYVSAVDSERDRKKPMNPASLRNVLLAVNPVLVLTLGDFAYACCQLASGQANSLRAYSASDLGELYRQNMIKLRLSDNEGQATLPLLGREALRDPSLGDGFIGDEDPSLFLSYFHYLGCTLGRLFLDLHAKKEYRWNQTMLKQ
jgi:hypothetical protein